MKVSARAVGIAARIWCDPEIQEVTMDIAAANKIAKILDNVLEVHELYPHGQHGCGGRLRADRSCEDCDASYAATHLE